MLRPRALGAHGATIDLNYVNFQTDDETDERTVESYRNNYERLGSVKATYDPSNLFRVNRNIRP